ncbi:MAG TPA: endonuclease/exonuclease/phosphatase family protein [Longimicrobiales bacterium]
MRRLLSLTLLLAGCATGRNYTVPDSPGWGLPAAMVAAAAASAGGPDTLRIVSFNIEYGLRVDSAIAVLTGTPELRGADVVLLQEMDAAGAERVATALRMGYAYFPATHHRFTHRDFGEAVLSRWPISEPHKIILPHRGLLSRTQRVASAVTIHVGERAVRVASLHAATPGEVGPRGRRDQLRAVLEDALRYPRAIVGGDLNSHDVGKVAVELGFAWPTEHGPKTDVLGRIDHIFLRGLGVPDSAASGTVMDNRQASDHKPVWAKGIVR